MTNTAPVYSARILGSPDIPVSIRDDSGRITLDSSRAPHVQGSVTLSVPDAALLEDLDPRDNRRLVIDAYPDSHLEPVYSDWMEQSRNVQRYPGDAPTGVVGWAAARMSLSNPGGYLRGVCTASAGIGGVGIVGATARSFNVDALPGEVWSLSAELRGSGTLAQAVLGIQFFSAAGTYITGSQALGAVGDTSATDWYTFTVVSDPAPAEAAYFRFVAYTVGVAAIGDVLELRKATAVPGATPASPFSGNDADSEFTQYRWLGAADASASVLETRTLTGWVQVPDGVPRSFDLGIREANPNRGDATVAVPLASDEALLGDFAQLVDDETPFGLASSLRAVVDYVLDKALGTALEVSPADDADMTPFWEVTNLLRNPAVVTNLNNWVTGGGVDLAYVSTGSSGEVGVTMTAATGAVFAVDTAKYNIPATPGKAYSFSLAQRYVGSASGGGRAVLRFLDNNNSTILEVEGTPADMTTVFARVEVTAVAPPSAVKVAPFWRVGGGVGRTYRLDQGLLHTSRFPVPPFTGGDADGGGYSYEFEGPSNDSASIRTPLLERDPEALVWRAGVSALEFLAPLIQAAGFRLVCDEQRRWTLRSAEYRADGNQNYRNAVNIITADEALSRAADEWFDGAVYEYTWTDADGIEQTRLDAFALTADPTKVIRRQISAPFPGVGRAEYAVRRAQGRGRTVTVSAQAGWSEASEQTLSIVLEGTPIQTGIAERVEFDLAGNTVTVSSRTTDTPAAAWILIPAGQAWLDSPVGESWTEEII